MLFLRYTASPAFDIAANWSESYHTHLDADDNPIPAIIGEMIRFDAGAPRMVTWLSPYNDGIVGARLDGLCGVPASRDRYDSLEATAPEAYSAGREGRWARFLGLYEGREVGRLDDGVVFVSERLLQVWDVEARRTLDPAMFERDAQRDGARRYRSGGCDALALALHDMGGLQLGLIEGLVREPGEDDSWEACHGVAVLDAIRSIHMDVDGIHPALDGKYHFSSEPRRLRLRLVSRDEMDNAFTMSGVSADEIAEAWTSARRDPVASRALRTLNIDVGRDYALTRERRATSERSLAL